MDLAIKAIEDALLVAYHQADGAATLARVEVNRQHRPRHGLGRGGARRRPGRREYDDTPDGFRPDRGDDGPAGHPAAAARRRGRADLRRVRRPRGRRRRGRHPAGPGPAGRPGGPRQARGDAAADRAGARRAVRARRAAALLRPARPQGLPRARRSRCRAPTPTWCASCSRWRSPRSRPVRSRSPRSRARPVTAARSRSSRTSRASTPRAPASARWAAGSATS